MAKTHSHCSGCSLCLLACPVWRQTRDIRLTPHGRAKALQHGASAQDLAASVAQCTLCGACEPACPEGIPLVDLVLDLRLDAPLAAAAPAPRASNGAKLSGSILLPGRALQGERLRRVAALLGCTVAEDDGLDIALGLETGVRVAPARVKAFLAGFDGTILLVVAEGLLLRRLREWLPDVDAVGLGAALSAHAGVRGKLRDTDLYVIETRAYHAEHAKLVRHYDALRAATGLATNLDLQRLAVPTTAQALQRELGLPAIDAAAQARWILEGRTFDRVVVEDAADCAVFAAVTDKPVVHVADL